MIIAAVRVATNAAIVLGCLLSPPAAVPSLSTGAERRGSLGDRLACVLAAGLSRSFPSVTYGGNYHDDAATKSFEETYSDNGDASTEDGRRVALRCWSRGTGRLAL